VTTVRFLGRDFPPMASIVAVAQALGYRSPTTALRVAERDGWPLYGPRGGRKVNLIALAERLCIPYEIASEIASDSDAGEDE